MSTGFECVLAATENIARRRRRGIFPVIEHGFKVVSSCGDLLCVSPEHAIKEKWAMYRPPIESNPRCPSCGGGSFAIWKGATKLSKGTGETVLRRPHGQYLCRERGCGRTFYDKTNLLRPKLAIWGPLRFARCIEKGLERRSRLGPKSVWIGQFILNEFDQEFLALPRRSQCSEKACAFPAHKAGKCRYHMNFFKFKWSMEWRAIDAADRFATQDNPHPVFTVMFGGEIAKSADRVIFEHDGGRDRGKKISDDYWREAVLKYEAPTRPSIRVIPDIKPQYVKEESATRNMQHTGAFVLWKGFGKKKIRKSQRNRPAGWHGNHPEQMPRKNFTRDTLKDLPQWTPSSSQEGRDHPDLFNDEEFIPLAESEYFDQAETEAFG